MAVKFPFESEVQAVDLGDKGHAIARDAEGRVYMVEGLVPGDRARVLALKKRKGIIATRRLALLEASADRVEPFCQHFGVCGGCKWQHMDYAAQLRFKEKSVVDAMERIGHIQIGTFLPIAGAQDIRFYRNKLEYTFSNKRWLEEAEIKSGLPVEEPRALGFHRPGAFDKIVDINHCSLQDDFGNTLRLAIGDFCRREKYSFFDLREQTGLMRNLMLRNSSLGEWMVCVIFAQPDEKRIQRLMQWLQEQFLAITSLQYAVNTKRNDSLYDLHFQMFAGRDHIIEQLGHVQYKISPQSFFQTNSRQAKVLYDITRDFAGLTGTETVYDLYCGTGSIGLYLADTARTIIGIEEVAAAIRDAEQNKALNQVQNAHFYTGDVRFLLDEALLQRHGKPDVIVTDPPRAGMHADVVKTLLQVGAPRMVYVSCNPATQARDLAMLDEAYQVDRMQPVDMFPHTAHVETVALLSRRNS
jgi:23S rRNA (uracil1939-C5)-methyltransferase